MASSGTYRNNFATGYALQLVWNVDSQNVANNTSTVNVLVQLISTGSSYAINSTATKYGTLNINGTPYNFSFSASLSGNQTKTIYSKSVIIQHNSDGTKSCAFSVTANINVTLSGTYYGAVSASGTGNFNTIPRASTPTLNVSSQEMLQDIVISISRASTSFTHTLKYVFGNLSGTIGTGIETTKTWTIPITLANAIPNSTSGIGTITCETYSESTLIGSKSISFTATVPTSIIPTISNVSITEATEGVASKFNAFVQNRSKLNVGITASGTYGSTITQYKTYIQAIEYHGNSFTSNIITASGTIGVVTIVTDSRGRTARYDGNITILAYSVPTISTFSAYRSDSSGNQNYEGQNLKIDINFLISNVNNLNDKYYEIVYRVKGTSTWSFIESGNLYSKNTSIITGAIFNVDNAYDLALNIYDYFSESHATIDIPTAFTLIDYHSSGTGIAFGKVAEKQNTMEIALDVDLTGDFIQEDRKTPTLQNDWVNYGSAYESASYFKDKCNIVHLAGLIKSGVTTAETVIFNLPEGYRPRVSEKFFAVSLNAICVIDVYTNGNVAIKTGANTGWLSLSGISFRAN